MAAESFTRLGDDLTLPDWHPLAGREAWACETCRGIFYPGGVPVECPYCTDDENDARAATVRPVLPRGRCAA